MIEIPFNFKGETQFQTYDDIVRRIEKFEVHTNIGKDESGEFPMYLIELGTSGKPAILITSVQHGTEWQGAQYGLSFVESLREDTFPDKSFRDNLLRNFHILYIPVVNPWGLEETYEHAITRGRNNSTNTNLNRDFDEFTQQEAINTKKIMDKYKPFAYFDLHLIRGHKRDTHLIIGNGQPETEYIRNLWADSLAEYSGHEVERWDGSGELTRGLSRRYMRDQSNEYTPYTLSYISEMSRPVQETAGFNAPLSDTELYKYGMASMYLFFKTSLDYFYLHNEKKETVIEKRLYVRDLSGNEYPLQATITRDYELNGNQSLTATILPSKVNKPFIRDISEMWEVIDFDGVAHKIIYAKREGIGNPTFNVEYIGDSSEFLTPVFQTNGNSKPTSVMSNDSLKVEIKAIPLFFDTLDNSRIYDEYNRHMTAQFAFNLIFETTGYKFILVGQFDAVEWEGFGDGESRLETFKRALNRYKAEFRIVGNVVYIERQIGRDTSFMYRHKLNASNIVQEIDATQLWTYAKGFGDYEDEENKNPGLKREYTSPLAKIIGIRHAPPIYDGRITDIKTMDNALKTLVNESLKISVSSDIFDLRKQGYALAQPELGDRVFLIDERIGLDDEVRIVDIEITQNWRGEVIDLKMTIGSEGITKRHQSDMSTAVDRINDLIEGRSKLPFSVLDDAVINATKALKDAQTELKFTTNGILAVEKNNPNNVTILNSAGIGVSTDGGFTFREAITGRGINASTIVTGTMVADFIAGGTLTSINGDTTFNLNTGNLDMEQANFTLGSGAKIDFTSSGNRITYRYTSGITRSSGLGVGLALGGQYPFSYLGTTGASELDTLSEYFSGFIANTTARIDEGGANSVSGYRFEMRNKASNWDKGLTFDWYGNTPTIRPINGHQYNYYLGDPSYLFDRLHVRQLRTVGGFEIRNNGNSGIGFRIDISGGSNTIKGINGGSNTYNLGASESYNHFDFGYINYLRASASGSGVGSSDAPYQYGHIRILDVHDTFYAPQNFSSSSDERLKKNVTDTELGLDFVNDIRSVDYEMIDDAEGRRAGFIAQELIETLEKHNYDHQSVVSIGPRGYYAVNYLQLISPTYKAIQELSEKVNKLEALIDEQQ